MATIRKGPLVQPQNHRIGGDNLQVQKAKQATETKEVQETPAKAQTAEVAAQFDGVNNDAPVQGGLLNQQVGQQKDLSPMGARFAMLDKTTGPVVKDELKQLAGTLDKLADSLLATPDGSAQIRAGFGQLFTQVEPVVAKAKEALDDVNGKVAVEEQSLNWFQKTFGMFVPGRVDDLWSEQKTLKSGLKDAEAFQAGARIGMRAGKEAAAESTPEHWDQKLTTTYGQVVAQPGDAATVAGLVKLQDQLDNASDLARLQAKGAEKDVSDFGKQVAWHQKWGWLDKVIGGESGRGHLLRTGKDQGAELGAASDAFNQVEAKGEGYTYNSVSELLKRESPAYAQLKARFDVLKPAHDAIKSVLREIDRGQSALEDAERWIARRDSLRMQEPAQYETVQEPRYQTNSEGKREIVGYDSVTRETQAYKSWESDYSHAKNQAEYEKHSAEDAVRNVNRDLPGLRQKLEALNDGHVGRFVNVDDDITHFWGGFTASFGMWSYDGSEVNDIQRQLSKLEGQVEMFDGKVEPEFQQKKAEVNSAIAHRRDELREM